jgi:hypothetical protein
LSHDPSDTERLLKMIERIRLLVAVDDDLPTETKLNTQPVLTMLEGLVADGEGVDREAASRYYRYLCGELTENADVEALLGAMRVFAPYL